MTLLFAFPEQSELAKSLGDLSGFQQGAWELRHFPDGESYVRILSDVRAQPVLVLCSLDRPNDKIMPLIFLARTLRELGAEKITLIAPYLGYMRQDKRFHDGEAVTSTLFAGLLSDSIDALVTIDPHLHRHKALEEIYTCACTALSAAALMAAWIKAQAIHPLIIGPDAESEQWVTIVAEAAEAPYVILEKTRHGDRNVAIHLPDITAYRRHTPVLIDDIISTATTMIKAIALLRRQGFAHFACLATHGVFAAGAYEKLQKMQDVSITTANTIPHISNAMDVTSLLAAAVATSFDRHQSGGAVNPS